MQSRLRMLASCMLGEVVEIQASAGLGGMFGCTLLLPERIDAFATHESNEQAYLLRVIAHVRCAELGIVVPDEPSSQPACLLLLLAAKAVSDALERDFAGARALRLQLASELCARRAAPDAAHIAGVLEAVTQFVLTGQDPWRVPLPAGLAAWWQRATGPVPASAAALHEHARELYQALARELPGPRGSVPEPVVLWGRLVGPVARGDTEAAAAAAPREPRVQPAHVVTLRRAIQMRRRNAPRREDRPLYHAFEKIETAEDYAGESGTPDAERDAAAMQEALEDLTLATAVRTQERPRDLIRAEVLVEPGGLEIAEELVPQPQVFRYPEWDHRRKRLREDYCTVIQESASPAAADARRAMAVVEIIRRHKRHIDDIRMHLVRSLYRQTVSKRQLDGPEIDVEAIVERHADLQARQSPPERLFLSTRKTSREFAVVLLFDTSFSTDAWIAGRRILDVEIESLIVLAAALEGYIEEEVLVATFHSQTRNSVRFGILKDFEQSWRHARELATSMVPEGYTRIGAAVRHATALLQAADARHKLLLLVSDGKPTDFDRYEGNYGVEDIAHAMREAAACAVQTFGLAIEREAKLYLARMLGAGRYRILPSTDELPDAMAEVFLTLATR
ncbi:MAG TPA: hypothetical protein VJR89_39270 [Polyangiales bacterium]|nr:hypothetical protein [Polyangiales bacterium]